MAYGTKYICTFDNLRLNIPATPAFTVEFLFKDYTEATFNIKGSAEVIKHSWDTDDPKAPIKGSNVDIMIINEAQTLPILSFLSLEDDGVKVRLLWNSQLVFEGFLLQDDCLETMVDFNHEISLKANDNLGLLKKVPFNTARFQQNYENFDAEFVTLQGVAPNTLVITDLGQTIHVGEVISTTGTLSGVYHVTGIDGDNYTVSETVTTAAAETVTLIVFRGDFFTLRSLLSVIKTCIKETGLELNTNVFANINEVTQDNTISFLEQTLIDPQTFNRGNDNWDDCYTALEKILKRFNCTLFQSKGEWNIIRWDELKYYSNPANTLHGFSFDSDFNFISDIALDGNVDIGIGENLLWESAPDHRIFRPYLFMRETFNYKQPIDFLRNWDLQDTGNLLRAYTIGTGDDLQYINEYEAKWWYYDNAFPSSAGVNGPAEYFIRVVQDSLHNEVERYMVIKNNAIHSYQMEVSKDDVIKFSYSVKSNTSYSSVSLFLRLTNGTNTVFAHEPGDNPRWQGTTGYALPAVTIQPDEWYNLEAETGDIPFDGLLTVYLREFGTPASVETLIRDIRLEVIYVINQSTKVIGHVHTSSQGGNIKLNEDEEIFVDSSPRNSIGGTLFRTTMTTNGLLHARATQWLMPGGTAKNLGEITTSETLNWRRYPRSIIEGTLFGKTGLPQYVSPLDVYKYNLFPDLNLVWGKLEIDYRNNTMTGTLWELYRDGEDTLAYNYVFKYLYALK